MAEIVQLQPGSIFGGRYRVERLIKAGGMGAVYEVRHTGNLKRWALKIMHADVGRDSGSKERFVREAQIDGLINSSYVVSVIDAGIDDVSSTPYLVMEYLEGEELGERILRGERFSPEHVITLLLQVARALDKAHAQGIIHRDLKPENIFLTQTEDGERVKILDFGIAKMMGGAGQSSTNGGGTPLYMAPEQTKRGRDIGPWTDVWALGLMTYTLLVGRSYWDAQTIGELYGELLDPSPREAPSVRAAALGIGLPVAFDSWFFGCVNNDVTKRFQKAGEAVVALGAAFGGSRELQAKQPTPSAAIDRTVFAPVAAGGTMLADPNTPIPRGEVASIPAYIPNARFSAAVGQTTTGGQASSAFEESSSPPKKPMKWMMGGIGLAVVGLAVGIFFATKKDPASRAGAGESEEGTASAADSGVAASAAGGDAGASKKKDGDSLDISVLVLLEESEKLNPFVALDGLKVHTHEVTRREYAYYLATLKGDTLALAKPLDGWKDAPIESLEFADKPVTWVTWEQADGYCKLISGRLPTSMEWSLAAGPAYPWGNNWPATLDGIAINAEPRPRDVSSSPKDKSSKGVFDLAGNVQEWTASVAEGSATIRGASNDMSAAEAKTAFGDVTTTRLTATAAGAAAAKTMVSSQFLGFRCVKPDVVKAPTGNVSTGAVVGAGNVKDADSVIARNRFRFKACYNAALANDPSAGGTVKVAVKIGEGGEVTNATVASSDAPAGLTSCIVAAFNSMKFSEPAGGSASFTIPVVLSAKK